MSDIIISGYPGKLATAVIAELARNYDLRHHTPVALGRQQVGRAYDWQHDIAAVVNCIGAYETGHWAVNGLWSRMLNSNLWAPMDVVMSALPHMTNGSIIINVTARAALYPDRAARGEAAYTGSKAAMSAVTASLKKDLLPIGIQVEEYLPGSPIRDYEAEARYIVGILVRGLLD